MRKEAIRKNFSKCARFYDRYATVQDRCASRLIAEIEGDDFGKILDIGCGTGNYTRLLRRRFPEASITALDISKEMVGIARAKLNDSAIEFVIRDAETLRAADTFDLITSNAAFQWLENVKGALSAYRNHLKEGGTIAFSLFGPRTYYELNDSLKALFGEDASTSSHHFLKNSDIREILRSLFREARITAEIYQEDHRSLQELLEKIKYTGTRGYGAGNGSLWTQRTIDDLERVYKKLFDKITATYQVFFCTGVR